MLNVALTGNIAAGKSTVAELFRGWGATLIDADQLAREAQQPGTAVLQAIARRFGKEILTLQGELDRPALRGLVMGDDTALAALNAIVHPAVQRRREALLAEAIARGDAVVVSDIPLLFEASDPALFDRVVLVDAPVELRRSRLVAHRGLSLDEADGMIRAQIAAERKRERSHFVIDNAGTLADLKRAARAVWKRLLADTSAGA